MHRPRTGRRGPFLYDPPRMRKTGPYLILIIGLLALIVDFVPGISVPDPSTGENRVLETKLGLDLQGGLRVEYQAKQAGDRIPRPEDLDVIRGIIENRVNATGVSEPVVTTQGSDRIVVELPGVSDPNAVRRLVGQTGRLDFVPLGSRPEERGRQDRPGPVPDPLLRRGAVERGDRDGPDRQARRHLHPEVDRLVAVRGLHPPEHRQVLRDRPRRQRHLRSGHPECDPRRQRPDQPGRDRRLPAQGSDRAGHGPPVRLAAVPDRGTVERHDQRDPRRAVPEQEPARRCDRDPPRHGCSC